MAKALGERLNLPVYFEPTDDNVYLADFYKDIRKHSFAMQVYLLNRRFSQQQQIIWSGRGGVQDRTIYEDSVFARMLRDSGLMDARDYDTYISLFNNMSNFMRRPSIIVHLDVSPEESLRRIHLRSRECESSISIEYLRALHAAYETFISDIARVIPVIRVDYSKFRTADEMADRIMEEYKRIANVRHVTFDDKDATSGMGSAVLSVGGVSVPSGGAEAGATPVGPSPTAVSVPAGSPMRVTPTKEMVAEPPVDPVDVTVATP